MAVDNAQLDLSHLPLAFLEAYPFPAFVLQTPSSDVDPPRPRLLSRDTDSTVRNNRNEGISPFSEAPQDSPSPSPSPSSSSATTTSLTRTPSEEKEADDLTQVVWSNDKWKLLTRSRDLLEVENTPDFLSWVNNSPVDKLYTLGLRHASARYHLSKTRSAANTSPGSKTGAYHLTTITAQPLPSPFSRDSSDLSHSPIPEMEEMYLDDWSSSRRSTLRSFSGLANKRLSSSTEHSTFSADNSTGRSSTDSYFPNRSNRNSSARVRPLNKGNRSSGEDSSEAYTAQMTEAAASCWDMVNKVDWAKTKLGPRSEWKDDFDALLSIVFQSPSQDAIWIGEDLQVLHNAPYRAILQDHQTFGMPGRDMWASIWDYLRPQLDRVLAGEAIYRENDLVMYRRYGNGTLMETYHDYRYVPIQSKEGKVLGLYNQSVDKTDQVLAERRLATVRSLSEHMLVVRSVQEYFESIIEVLEENPKDAPFVMCYSVTPQPAKDGLVQVSVDLQASLGVPEDDPSAPRHMTTTIASKIKTLFGSHTAGLSSPTLSAISALSSGSNRRHQYVDAGSAWPIQKALSTRQCVVVNDVTDLIRNYPLRVWDELPIAAIVVPICSDSSTEIPDAVMILGLNLHRPFDTEYDSWVHVIRSHLASSYTSVKAVEAEKKRIEDEVRMEKAKTAWFRGAAHDLRSPLALVSGPLDDVLHSDLTPKQKHSLTTAKRNVDRLMRLVDALMDFSRLEAGKVEGRFVPMEIGPFIVELSELFRPAIERMGIDLVLDLQPTPTLVYVDPTLFETVISNLVGNAMKYTEEGEIIVSLRYTDEHAEISVIDTGVGIPEDELQMVTEVFHRASTAVHTGSQGTGLGLSIVREILHLHEGELVITSKVAHSPSGSHGSTFTARIPLKERRAAAAANSTSAVFGKYGQAMIDEAMRWKRDGASSTEGSNSEIGVESTLGSNSHYSNGLLFEPDDTLLIIDDNSDMRDYVRSIFSPYCRVREASNGEMGRRMALEHTPDLILSDVLMPKMSGIELLSSLRGEPSTRITPFVMLSAVAGDDARLDALMNGAEDYMTKPFKPKELLARVHLQMHVGKKRKQLELMYAQRQTELALLSDYCPSGIMRANAEGVLTYANEAWRTMAGMPPGSDPADWPNYVDEDNQGIIYPAWSRFLTGKETQARIGWKWKNGSVSSGFFIRLDLLIPGVKGILGCINDVTHEEMRIVEAERRRIEAEESKHQQELLVDLTSHEIRTPVSAILQCSSLVKENLVALTEQLKLAGPGGFTPTKDLLDDMDEDIEALESIYQCGLVQERIAGDVLSLARIQLDMLSLHDVETDLRKEAKKVLSVFASEAKMKKIELRLQFGETINQAMISKIQTDHVRLGQVVTNLISNAIRFTSSSDTRQITVQYDVSFLPPDEDTCALPPSIGLPAELPAPKDTPMWLFVSVKDTGPGLGPQELAILFKRFSQGNKMIHTRYGGSGLGLFICRKITELLGGRIEVRSELGSGSNFRFFIKVSAAAPLSPLAAYVEATSARPVLSTSGTTTPMGVDASMSSVPTVETSATPPAKSVVDIKDLHILIVEDNIINQTVLKRQINKAGLTCDVADNGLIALNLIHEAHRQSKRAGPARKKLYDCVLMDLEMPVMDGLSAVREIRAAEQKGTLGRQMVVALTGNARQGQIDQAIEAGMDDVMIKPYVLSKLLVKIREMAAKRLAAEEAQAREL